MSGELFQEILDKLHELHEFFQKLARDERWAFLYLACLMADNNTSQGKIDNGPID